MFTCLNAPTCCENCESGFDGADGDLDARPVFDEVFDEQVIQRGVVSDEECRSSKGLFMKMSNGAGHGVLASVGNRDMLRHRAIRVTEAEDFHSKESRHEIRRPTLSETGRTASSMLGTPACLYQAEESDPIDRFLLRCIRELDEYSRATLLLRRRGPGRYEIDGRSVTLCFAVPGDPSSIVVIEEGSREIPELLLPAYLQQAAHVAVSLGGEQARSLRRQQMSFSSLDVKTPCCLREDSLRAGDRHAAMRVACEESRLREQTMQAAKAQMSRSPSRQSDPFSPLRSLNASPLPSGSPRATYLPDGSPRL